MLELRPDLNTRNVLSRITSQEIFERYCPGFKTIGKKFRAVFRSDDVPSALIDYYKGDLLYKDFGEQGSSRAIPFVSRLYGVDYYGALKIINRDFNLGLGDDTTDELMPVSKLAIDFIEKSKKNQITSTEIYIKRREFTVTDLSWWGQYYWTLEMLKSVDIYPISHFWIKNSNKSKNILFKSAPLSYTFDYYWHENIFRRKIYQPDSKIKFVSNVDFSIVQGYKRLSRTGNILIITSSLKDCGPFWRLGYDAIAPNSESSFLPDNFISKMKERFRRIIIWFDNDWDKIENSGVKNAQKFGELYNIEYFYNPDGEPKDPSDFCKKYSLSEFSGFFLSKIN